ncbi:DoxX family protein [Undibacterium cyanobacteriorum]|uniref:DoxX family protein n=1 Tax=Undibacterium cyanobacteriorum TaxID=3073561 RepID=A0ABY9RF57_9BURK|nr:DoxX family protein [Undibacterium sp. 20NA77.5]WMW79299.1 DoxX family protein [Undibacterium sp. 20NA77.5]
MHWTKTFDEERLWILLRCFLALLVSVHGWHRLFDGTVLTFAENMQGQIFAGYFLVLVLQAMELFGSLLLASGFFVSILSYGFAIIYTCAIYFYHSRFGWFQSGGIENGAEYAVCLVMCFLAIGLRYQPSRIFAWRSYWRPRLASSLAKQTQTRGVGIDHALAGLKGERSVGGATKLAVLSWQLLRWTVLILIAIHVVHRVVTGSVQDMVLLMPSFLPQPTWIAIAATILQGLALTTIALGRHQRCAYFCLIALNVLALVFHHAQQGWIVSGSDKDGMEYVALLTVILLLCGIDQTRLKKRVNVNPTIVVGSELV